jgi:hypothetical protein
MGLDVLYQKLGSASTTNGFLNPLPPGNAPFGAVVGGPLRVDDQDNWQFRFRVHRDFYP